MHLHRSHDRKVANMVTPSANSLIANAFGLPAGRQYSCRGMTSYCGEICYAGKLERVFKGLLPKLMENWELLQACADQSAIEALLEEMVQDFEYECKKYSADRLFRIHWDGDFYSDDYARAWRAVIQRHPETQFWTYTRVASVVPILIGLDNLSLYFSADRDNKEIASQLREKHGVNVAYLDDTFNQAKEVMLEILGKPAARCPENNKALPLIDKEGSACAKCRLCVDGRASVLFSKTKK